MKKRASAKTKENAFKGTVKSYFKTKQTVYMRGDIATFAKGLIKKVAEGNLKAKDLEIAEMVNEKFGGMTSIKSIQYYRHQLRKDGIIPMVKKRAPRRYIEETLYEVENDLCEIKTFTSKQLITFARKLIMQEGADRVIAKEAITSIDTAVLFLTERNYHIINQDNYTDLD